jgi:hypothetical protein
MTVWFWLALVCMAVAAVLFVLLPSTRDAISKMVRGAPARAEVDRLLSAHRDVLEDNFSLCLGQSYRVLVNRSPLARDMQVIYRGTHQEPANRGWDYFHQFELDDGRLLVLPLDKTPRTVAASLLVFADTKHPEAQTWRNPSLMSGLYHRAKRIRERSAAAVVQGVVGITEAVPRLYELALTAEVNSPYSIALERVAVQALPLISKLDDSVGADVKLASERILATLGSKKYVADYREALLSSDPIEVRRAVQRLAQIGDRLAEPRLQALAQHSNMNVRFAVRDALAKLAQLEA